MELPVNGSTHLIPAYYSFIDPERLSWPSWLTCIADGLPTLVVTHQLQVERRTGKVRRSETDVIPLCDATNQLITQISGQNYRRRRTSILWMHSGCVNGWNCAKVRARASFVSWQCCLCGCTMVFRTRFHFRGCYNYTKALSVNTTNFPS